MERGAGKHTVDTFDSFQPRYRISQKDITVLDQLKLINNVKLHTRLHKATGLTTYSWTCSSQWANFLFHDYFFSHCLQTMKYENFLKWRRALALIATNDHLTRAGKAEIISLKYSMNTKLDVKTASFISNNNTNTV
uniref:Group I intronic ORF n=1 Tax=Volvocales sp. NrCl902 TaxID=2682054 RepID=A0A7G1GGB9_9CHLO|nr:group I intronic ORF [Volvocales sp. NrCl902]